MVKQQSNVRANRLINPYHPPNETRLSDSDKNDSRKVHQVSLILLLGFLLPGVPSMMHKRWMEGVAIFAAIPIAFVFFGPIWGIFLFAGTNYTESGLYPFLLVLWSTPCASVYRGLVARRKRLRDNDLSPESLP